MRNPSHRTRLPALVPAIVMIALGTGWNVLSAQAGDAPRGAEPRRTDAEALSRSQELIALQDRLRRRTEEALAKRREQRTRLDTLEAEARSARRRNDTIAREIEKREARIAELLSAATNANEKAEAVRTRETSIKERLRTFLRTLDGRIEGGIPWKIADRRAGVTGALEQLEDERTNAAAALASVGRLQKEQEAFGRLVESSTLSVEVNGTTRAVPAFHIGLLGVIFALEAGDDGQGAVIGFAGTGQSLEDGLAAVRSRPEAAKGYLQTIDILNRRRTPQLTNLFLPSLPTEKGGSR